MSRVVVIGGGVIGCAAAERLTLDHHEVTLFERDQLGAHASGAAAGELSPSVLDSDNQAREGCSPGGKIPETPVRARPGRVPAAERSELARRHLEWCLRLAERAPDGPHTDNSSLEFENCRAALARLAKGQRIWIPRICAKGRIAGHVVVAKKSMDKSRLRDLLFVEGRMG